MASATNSSAISQAEYQMVRHIIDIEDELEDLKRSGCYIYRVPCNLRKLNMEAYTPQLISIGPLHLGKLKPMQKEKMRYFHFFWVRVSNEQDINGYKEFLSTKEVAIRSYYAEKFPHITKDQFVDMLLLDAVFIMELFLRISEFDELSEPNGDHLETESEQKGDYMETKSLTRWKQLQDDYILNETWFNKSIQRDLLLLENQIPIFILDTLYKTVVPDEDKNHMSFLHLAHDYFKCFDPQKDSDETQQAHLEHKLTKHRDYSNSDSQKKTSNRFKEKSLEKAKHFTDLIRYFYISNIDLGKSGPSSNVLRTATKLQEAGVSFEAVKKKHLLHIKFEKHKFLSWFLCLGCIPHLQIVKARLRIPQLKVDHMTECVLRNLIAFEQCHYPDKPYICNYVSLIDSLIHTKDDVELLVEKEVIVHELGSDKEVATLVNGLCKHVVTNSTCYKDIINNLSNHYQNIWNRTMAALRLVYFRDPWRASSTLVGIAVLVFTIFNFCRIVRVVF